MTKRFLVLLIVPLVHAFWGLDASTSRAAPIAAQSFTIGQAQTPPVLAGYDGCGWDYPCPPSPDYRHRFRHRNGQTYIRSNYGTVNVYVNGGRRETGPNTAGWDCCEAGPQVPGGEAEGGYDRNCGGYPCREECGAFCWMHRFRQGYCGHGCEAYRKRVHFERAERVVKYPRPIYYREAPPPPEPSYGAPEPYLPETRYRSDEHYPPIRREPTRRERFEGPKYPADCSHGGC